MLALLSEGANENGSSVRVEGSQSLEKEKSGCLDAGAISPAIEAQRASPSPIRKEKVTPLVPDLRSAWERLNAEKEAQAARDTIEADRRRERARFEQARARWAAEDAAARAQRIDLLDRLMRTDDGPIDWRNSGF